LGRIVKNIYKHDICVGTDLVPDTPMRPLKYNIINMRIGLTTLGSNKWMLALLKLIRHQNIPELIPLIGIAEYPLVPSFIGDRWFSKDNHIYVDGEWMPWRGPKPSRRARKTLELLRGCEAANLSFLTVVTTPAMSYATALAAIVRDGKRLASQIKRRYPNSIYVMVPEVDIVRVKNISASLFADSRWKDGLDDNQIIYKIHFHGLIYVPSMLPEDVQQAFKVTITGKRSKLYAGANQVRAIPIRHKDDDPTKNNNVYNCFGYATKAHYRPPTTERMSECFAEWLLLTNEITSNPDYIITGGSVRGILKYCSDCKCHFRPDDRCNCKSTLSVADDLDASNNNVISIGDTDSNSDSISDINSKNTLELYSSDNSISLNCSPANLCQQTEKQTIKNKTGLIVNVVGFCQKLWQKLNPAMAP